MAKHLQRELPHGALGHLRKQNLTQFGEERRGQPHHRIGDHQQPDAAEQHDGRRVVRAAERGQMLHRREAVDDALHHDRHAEIRDLRADQATQRESRRAICTWRGTAAATGSSASRCEAGWRSARVRTRKGGAWGSARGEGGNAGVRSGAPSAACRPAHCFVARPRWALSRTIPDLSIVAEAGWRRFSWAVRPWSHVGRAAVPDGRFPAVAAVVVKSPPAAPSRPSQYVSQGVPMTDLLQLPQKHLRAARHAATVGRECPRRRVRRLDHGAGGYRRLDSGEPPRQWTGGDHRGQFVRVQAAGVRRRSAELLRGYRQDGQYVGHGVGRGLRAAHEPRPKTS